VEPSKECRLEHKCLVHGFSPVTSRLLVEREFDKIVIENFTVEEQRFFRLVAHGQQ